MPILKKGVGLVGQELVTEKGLACLLEENKLISSH